MKSLGSIKEYQLQRRNRTCFVDIYADVYRDIFTGRRKSSQLIIRGGCTNYTLQTLATALSLSAAGLSAAKTIILDLVRQMPKTVE